jgi:hypothetical protein
MAASGHAAHLIRRAGIALKRISWYKTLTLFVGAIFVMTLTACSTTAVDARMTYWRAETAAQLPLGATKAQAEEFFTARGAELKCCVAAPPGPKFHFINERKVGHGFMMEYDVVVLVQISDADRVESVLVQRWGIGL